MREISGKQSSLREASASAVLLLAADTLAAIRAGTLPKGDPFGFARSAAFLAAKQTSHLIPHCHPVRIDGMQVDFEMLDAYDGEHDAKAGRSALRVLVHCTAVDRTGIEMEAITAASIAAVTLYDLCKPIDSTLEITEIRLIEKKGGKGDRRLRVPAGARAAVLICSDSTAAGEREDRSGAVIREILEGMGCPVVACEVVPDEPTEIQRHLRKWAGEDKIPFLFTTGGTGLSPRDRTVEAVRPLLDREVPGIAEAMRVHGSARTPFAMLSRSIAGTIGGSIVVTLPGSSRGARESLEGILPGLFHAKRMIEGGDHPSSAGWDPAGSKTKTNTQAKNPTEK